MPRSLHAEFQKAHRRHDLLVCLLLPVTVLLWSGYAAPDEADSTVNAFSALFYSAPVMNAILMPIGMAVLATRLWDVEVKGGFPKLLYTLQSRRSLFAAKAALGFGEVLLITALETASVLLIGRWKGYSEVIPPIQIAYFFLCTLAVCTMLLFSELLLSVLLSNPLPALCTGVVGALVGLFSAFMPPVVSLFVPWGYFIPLSAYILADWDPDTRIAVYGTRDFRLLLLAWTILLAVGFFLFTWRAIREKEV
ncbi:MAG: ABC transporter permease [Subdoligranulum variabile]|nr:MAG: ABC transporter permease [Subdoligranulum variabile]